MVLYTKAALVAIIAYTNLLHIQSGEPVDVRREQPELWNQQIKYAENLLAHMESTGFVTNRSQT